MHNGSTHPYLLPLGAGRDEGGDVGHGAEGVPQVPDHLHLQTQRDSFCQGLWVKQTIKMIQASCVFLIKLCFCALKIFVCFIF